VTLAVGERGFALSVLSSLTPFNVFLRHSGNFTSLEVTWSPGSSGLVGEGSRAVWLDEGAGWRSGPGRGGNRGRGTLLEERQG
jgi:hypothetical protein